MSGKRSDMNHRTGKRGGGGEVGHAQMLHACPVKMKTFFWNFEIFLALSKTFQLANGGTVVEFLGLACHRQE